MAARLLKRGMDRVTVFALVSYLAIAVATLRGLWHGHGLYRFLWLAPALAGWCYLVAWITHFDLSPGKPAAVSEGCD
jgi:hypothetical protein